MYSVTVFKSVSNLGLLFSRVVVSNLLGDVAQLARALDWQLRACIYSQ